ncbi:hypothetical protein PGT21_031524 [Puccinia graminis f. sp. tritici]|uniref:Uncharacterized protein n=1 Tax=Puccinia graminis f. sp. tritici TaxID=56615 RepID=A0A5B0QYD2_PUCGR|nr:hypothetical protein PGT21_031524 [Puccinia graminis f. sp. tritici]
MERRSMGDVVDWLDPTDDGRRIVIDEDGYQRMRSYLRLRLNLNDERIYISISSEGWEGKEEDRTRRGRRRRLINGREGEDYKVYLCMECNESRRCAVSILTMWMMMVMVVGSMD